MGNRDFRIERDSIGTMEVPAEAFYGVQTQRAVQLYPLKGEKPLSAYPELVTGMLYVKKAAALANMEASQLERPLACAIVDAVDYLIDNYPEDQFPVHAFHGGGGISSNMNVNEVIANLANRNGFGQALGSYAPVHPNDHVNLNNSTSDVLSTACHIAVIAKWQGLESALGQLADIMDDQGQRWSQVQKISRTCLQDAVEIGFKEYFSGYSTLVRRNIHRIKMDVDALHQVNLGGNIIGRRGDCSDEVSGRLIEELNKVIGTNLYRQSDNLIDCSQNHDDLIGVANRLDLLSRGLIKIAKDFRLMASGPQTGLGEITLPAVQPGSSAMPGKVNPTIPEFLIHCCMQASGRCFTAQMTQDHGELDYTPWQTMVINNILDAIACLENGVRVFTQQCLAGVEVNVERNWQNTHTLIPTVVRLKQAKGYSFASRVFKETGGDLDKIRRYLDEE